MSEMPISIGQDGWCKGVLCLHSEHFNERPKGEQVSLVVLHSISLPPGEFSTGAVEDLFLGCLDVKKDSRLADLEGIRVSSHFLISREGRITQFVSCNDRAWHAGLSSFLGRDNCNDFSVGIELEGTDCTAFESEQYASLVKLLTALSHRYPITAVVAHSDVAPGRKTDPGYGFDWERLEREKERFGNPTFPGIAASMMRANRNARVEHTVV